MRKKIAAGLLVAATMSVATMLNQEFGDLAPEKVVAEQPKVIIATGGSWAKDPKEPEVLPHVARMLVGGRSSASSLLH